MRSKFTSYTILTTLVVAAQLNVGCGDDGESTQTSDAAAAGDAGRSVEAGASDTQTSSSVEAGAHDSHDSTTGQSSSASSASVSSDGSASDGTASVGSSSEKGSSGSTSDVVSYFTEPTSSTTDASTSTDAPPQSPDLTIQSASLSMQGLTTVEVSDFSCEIQDGCYQGGGTRTVIPFELKIINSGEGPLEIGAPWERGEFYLSACGQYRSRNFVMAEVLGSAGEVLAVNRLPTSCIADVDSNTYSCSVQGLNVGDVSDQPGHTCSGLDVTGLAPGAYSVRLTVNANHAFAEADYTNNSIEVQLERPECEETFCGGVCCPEGGQCVNDQCLLPDLRANQDAVERSLIIRKQTFGENACEIAEACIGGPGKRRLLEFEGRIENVGSAALNPGPEENNPLFEFSECHEHHHFLDFTDYKLLAPDGSVAVQGHKQSFCLVSMDRVEDYEAPVVGSVVHPEPGETGCNYLEAGWADIYSVGTPCQWVDITDAAPGDYVLQVAVNPAGRIAEASIENNIVQVPVHIPADAPCQEEEVCGDVVDQDCDGRPDFADRDCTTSGFCCGEEDVCGLEGNFRCDCEGAPAWEATDCGYENGYGGECCGEEDTCGWANDGVCDCRGDAEWDQVDCDRQNDYYGYYNYCCFAGIDFCDDGFCDCQGADEIVPVGDCQDTAQPPADDAGVSTYPEEVQTSSSPEVSMSPVSSTELSAETSAVTGPAPSSETSGGTSASRTETSSNSDAGSGSGH